MLKLLATVKLAMNNTFLVDENITDRVAALCKAIQQALSEAQLSCQDIDIICGTSDGNKENDEVETPCDSATILSSGKIMYQ